MLTRPDRGRTSPHPIISSEMMNVDRSTSVNRQTWFFCPIGGGDSGAAALEASPLRSGPERQNHRPGRQNTLGGLFNPAVLAGPSSTDSSRRRRSLPSLRSFSPRLGEATSMCSCRFADLGGRDRGPGSDPAAGQPTSVGRDVAGVLQRSPKTEIVTVPFSSNADLSQTEIVTVPFSSKVRLPTFGATSQTEIVVPSSA